MKIVLQRCSRAEVRINGETVGRIGTGFVVLVGITHNDTREDAEFLAKKVAGMRVFEDTEGKMNLSLAEVGGQILSISQFTLYGNARKGNRPSFIEAAALKWQNRYTNISTKCCESNTVCMWKQAALVPTCRWIS